MKTISIVVPVYNTELYLQRCLDSVLLADILEDIEIILVNDGSTDSSLDILEAYQRKFSSSIVLVNKENAGHGSTINAALAVATGKYFRVLDSDDWFDSSDFIELVGRLKEETADVVLTDYSKEFVLSGETEYLEYKKLKDNASYNFNEIDLEILCGEYFMMATSTYRTELLRNCGLALFERTFYVDMQFNVYPIPAISNFTYYDLNIYRYFLGRKEQSVNPESFVKRESDHERVVRFLVDYFERNKASISPNKQKYLETILQYTLYTHYTIYCNYGADQSLRLKIKAFDKYLRNTSPVLYNLSGNYGDIRYWRKTGFKRFFLSKKVANLLKKTKRFIR